MHLDALGGFAAGVERADHIVGFAEDVRLALRQRVGWRNIDGLPDLAVGQRRRQRDGIDLYFAVAQIGIIGRFDALDRIGYGEQQQAADEARLNGGARAEERRGGKEWGSTCRPRWTQEHQKKKKKP